MTDDNIPADGPTARRTQTLLAEDVVLALFDPRSGTIAGENTLFYVLGGAVLTDLAGLGLVESEERWLAGTIVRAAGDRPDDELLARTWDYIAAKPRGVQGVLAGTGPELRGPILDRLVERGDIARVQRRALGVFPTTTLSAGDTDRRVDLIAAMRSVLVDGTEPDARTAAVIALVSASGGLPTMHAEIPWSSATATRATALQQGDWSAGAAAAAVTRTMIAVVTNALTIGAVIARR